MDMPSASVGRGARVAPLLATLGCVALALLVAPAPARAEAYLPPPGKVFSGLTGGRDVTAFEQEVGAHPSVFQFFTHWGEPLDWAFDAAARSRARPMLHFSTSNGRRELITPRDIAAGEGDGYLIELNRRLAASGQVTYVRLMAEMNGHWNPYCAFDRSGRPRGPSHSTASFRGAWRRSALVLRGGPIEAIDAKLARADLPPLRGAAGGLPTPKVSLLWVPQVAGAPDTRANAPRAYWPGRQYVDWVGTDFYSRYPNFAGLERFYRAFPGKPFAFGEWAVWGRDDPAFVRRLFAWARSHPRARLLMYNQGNVATGPFRLYRHPRARAALRRELADPRFAPFAPELAPAG